MATKQKLVVVGNGMAGARAVEEILARGGAEMFDIVMFGDEPYGNYNRILLSNVLNGSQEPTDIFLNPLEWYRENAIRLHAGVRVTEIDRSAKIVTGSEGTQEPYDKLLIATGSRPFVPPMAGLTLEDGCDKPGVFVFRTIDDCTKIAGYASKCRKAAVLGGGLLGLEAARGLLNYGPEVHVIHLMASLMNQQLDAISGDILRTTMERMGVHVHLNASTTAVLGEESVSGLAFKDGTTLDCDMLVISTGIRPNAEIGARCGLTVERAIVTDDQMRSIDDPDVYVVGECAQHRGKVYGLVQPLWEQAQTLADHITERNLHAAYHGSKLATKLKVMGVELASMGSIEPADEKDEVVQFAEPKRGIYKKLIIRDGILQGAILLGDTSKAASLMQAYDRGTSLPEERASLLFDLGGPKKEATMLEMPDDAQVCNCNGVSKGAIRRCVVGGKRSMKSVMDATRAGMGCGSCKMLVKEIVEWACEGQVEEDPSIHYYVAGISLPKPELVRAIQEQELKSVSAVFQALADGVEDAASKPGLASLLKTLWGAEYEDERDARFINDRVHANIQKEDLPKVWKDLDMPSGHAYAKSFRTCKTCVGTDFCRYGVGDSTGLGIKIEQRFQGMETPGKIKMATAGCPRNCSEALVKDIGAVAVEGGKWEIYVGGAAGAHVRKGDMLCVVESHEEVLLYAGRFMQYYRENAKYLERTYGFLDRVGIDRVRAVVVEDSEGTAARLDAAMQASVDAYVDPWLEAYKPNTPYQFAETVPVEAR
jgi:nitrite reductase (NADH) large subunit